MACERKGPLGKGEDKERGGAGIGEGWGWHGRGVGLVSPEEGFLSYFDGSSSRYSSLPTPKNSS